MYTLKVTIFFALLALCAISCSKLVSCAYVNKEGRTTVNLIKSFGYPVEVYNVISEDNYFLTTIRIPGRRFEKVNSIQNATEKPVVFLMHGLFVSSYEYVCSGPNHSIALILADKGYDVWLPNCRGTIISRKHVHLNPDRDMKYWDFSWHEIGYYDIPANVDLIRNVTGKDEMAFVGVSQGTIVFFVMAADRPEYNKYFKVSIMLGPTLYLGHTTCFLVNLIKNAGLIEPMKELGKQLGIHEFIPSAFTSIVRPLLGSSCRKGSALQPICMKLLTMTLDATYDINLLNKTSFPEFLKLSGIGTSTLQGYHYLQIIATGEFDHYDFGRKENMIRYHSEKPPPYNVQNIQVPIMLVIGDNDVFAQKEDIDRYARELPNSTVVNVGHGYSHWDYLVADSCPEVVHKRVIKLIEKYLGT